MTKYRLVGIDGGASKVMVQSAELYKEKNWVSPGNFQMEVCYSDHPDWNPNFIPVSIHIQKQEYLEGHIQLTEAEKNQGNVLVEILNSIVSQIDSESIGFCFPGIKNKHGVVMMANGPRIPDILNRLEGIQSIYHDSDCCMIGERKSSLGNLNQCENAIYLGGGTGIADGIILKNEIINFDSWKGLKRSWEMILPSGESVESCISPRGMMNQWNSKNSDKVESLNELSKKNNFDRIVQNAVKAFSFLVQDRIQFFKSNRSTIEKIVIGQRLGLFLRNSVYKKFWERETNIPIIYSTDRRTSALGSAWKKFQDNQVP